MCHTQGVSETARGKKSKHVRPRTKAHLRATAGEKGAAPRLSQPVEAHDDIGHVPPRHHLACLHLLVKQLVSGPEGVQGEYYNPQWRQNILGEAELDGLAPSCRRLALLGVPWHGSLEDWRWT